MTWKDKNGNAFLPEDVDDKHLLNAVKETVVWFKNSNGEWEYLENKNIEEKGIMRAFPIYPKLCAEAMSRNLIS